MSRYPKPKTMRFRQDIYTLRFINEWIGPQETATRSWEHDSAAKVVYFKEG